MAADTVNLPTSATAPDGSPSWLSDFAALVEMGLSGAVAYDRLSVEKPASYGALRQHLQRNPEQRAYVDKARERAPKKRSMVVRAQTERKGERRAEPGTVLAPRAEDEPVRFEDIREVLVKRLSAGDAPMTIIADLDASYEDYFRQQIDEPLFNISVYETQITSAMKEYEQLQSFLVNIAVIMEAQEVGNETILNERPGLPADPGDLMSWARAKAQVTKTAQDGRARQIEWLMTMMHEAWGRATQRLEVERLERQALEALQTGQSHQLTIRRVPAAEIPEDLQ